MKRILILSLCTLFLLSACDNSLDEGYGDEYGDEYGDIVEEDIPSSDENRAVEGETAVSPNTTAAIFNATNCPFTADTDRQVDCGYLTVPENRTTNSDQTIEIAVAILYAATDNPLPDPVVFLTGGPGDGALSDLAADAQSWTDYQFSQDRDIIFVDQRGTGYSLPFLDCPEIEAEDAGPDAEQQCQERLVAQGIDLTAYNTAENAADVADLMAALGIDSYNLLGISYGTRLALTLMRDHPAGVRAVILDSPFPPNARTPQEEGVAVWHSIQALFADCATDPDCAAAFPDLENQLIDAVIALNDQPNGELIGDDVVAVIEKMLFSGDEYGYLVPILIDDVSYGQYQLFEELAQELLGFGASRRQEEGESNSSEGMYNSVICHDEYAFASEAEAEAAIVAAIPEPLQAAMSLGVFQLYETCRFWGAGAAPAIENEAVVSAIPTLVLVGEYDPATPPAWGELTVQTLSNGRFYEIPSSGHSLVSTSSCAISLAEAFVQDPAAPLDDTCVRQMPLPEFELP